MMKLYQVNGGKRFHHNWLVRDRFLVKQMDVTFYNIPSSAFKNVPLELLQRLIFSGITGLWDKWARISNELGTRTAQDALMKDVNAKDFQDLSFENSNIAVVFNLIFFG
ncbi:unnamed protein product [Allacma fusca]|uniref:Uncharacterized protein n=1 Tax=Allacma fusca TaxID=39272 RepID=A0A8J2KY27_9HEXA|nr:unnamed protein product [Allacma fusca]